MLGHAVAEGAFSGPSIDRRQWGRFLSDVGQLIVSVTPTERRSATVVDESFGGIGVLVDDSAGLEPGLDLDLTYEGVPMRGTVRSVRPHDPGHYRIGIQWKPSQPYDHVGHDASAQIRGRLRILLRTWEAGQWDELARAVACFKEEAEALRLDRLARHASELLDALCENRPVTTTPESLVDLVDACLDVDTVIDSTRR